MATTMVQFRVDEQLKQASTAVYEQLGLDLPSALRMFLKRSVAVNGLPFPATNLQKPPFKAVEDMTQAEFDAMLNVGYQQSLRDEGIPAEEVFTKLEKKYGL